MPQELNEPPISGPTGHVVVVILTDEAALRVLEAAKANGKTVQQVVISAIMAQFPPS